MRYILILFLLFLPLVSSANKNRLYLFNWTEYMPDKIISAFEKETGIDVIYSTYDSNEVMYSKIKILGGKGYDIVFPSTYYISKMRKQNLLHKIDLSKISNFKYLNKDLLYKSFDPENRYSIPYLWGTTGIGCNSKYVNTDEIKSWNDLWKKKYKGKVLLTDDLREVFTVGLRVLGYSGNDQNRDHINEAYEQLKRLLPNVKLFASDSPKQPFLNNEVYLGMLWNGEAYMASRENPYIKYIYPEEGAIIWVDSMAIPSKAKNIENAYRFIDFVLRPEISKAISEELGYATANTESLKIMNDTIRNNKIIYPDNETIKNGEFQADVGDSILFYENLWERLKIE